MKPITEVLNCCLYFTANTLGRIMTTMAEEEFKRTELSPNYAFIILLVGERPGVTQKEIGEYLQLTPSTITRFVDKLETKGLVRRAVQGKSALLYPTEAGQELAPELAVTWKRLYHRYSRVLGYNNSSFGSYRGTVRAEYRIQ